MVMGLGPLRHLVAGWPGDCAPERNFWQYDRTTAAPRLGPGNNMMDNPAKVGLSGLPLRRQQTGFGTRLNCGQCDMTRLTCITTTFNEGAALLGSVAQTP